MAQIDYAEEMNRRIAAGEFGNPCDMRAVNEAWAALLKEAQEKYKDISGLWKPRDRVTGEVRQDSKVAFEGRASKQIVIPEGAKIICFKNNSENERAPELNLVWTRD